MGENLRQKHLMMGLKLPVQCLTQGRQLRTQATARQVGQDRRVCLSRQERV